MRSLLRFWKSLDEIPGAAASRFEWRMQLGEDWLFAEQFLRSRGDIVAAIPCPSLAGEGCPRTVVRVGPGSYRGVCGHSPRECDTIELALEDVEVLALDRRGFAQALAKALQVDFDYREQGRFIHLGRHMLAAGVGFPVSLILGAPFGTDHIDFHQFEDGTAAIFASSDGCIRDADRSVLRARGRRFWRLEDVLYEDSGRLTLSHEPAEIFSELRARVSSDRTAPGRPPWALPPGTKWEQVKFHLSSLEHVTVSSAGKTYRLEPEHLGLKDKKTGRGTAGWTLLITVIRLAGELTFSSPTNASEKQVQLLNRTLRTALGVEGDAVLRLERGSYQASFVSTWSLPRAVADFSGDAFEAMKEKYRQLPSRRSKRPKAV